MSINQLDGLIIGFIDDAFEEYKEEFQEDYEFCTNEELFSEFACHDFLFCTILHGEPNTKYDIRRYYENCFKDIMEYDIHTYSRIVGIVVKYFREYPDESCQEIECFKPISILKYYCFVFVKLNQHLFIEGHSPFTQLDYSVDDSEFESGSDFEDD